MLKTRDYDMKYALLKYVSKKPINYAKMSDKN